MNFLKNYIKQIYDKFYSYTTTYFFLVRTYYYSILDKFFKEDSKIKLLFLNKKLGIIVLLFICMLISLYKIGTVSEFYYYWGFFDILKKNEFIFFSSYFFIIIYSAFFFYNFLSDYFPEYRSRIYTFIIILCIFTFFITV